MPVVVKSMPVEPIDPTLPARVTLKPVDPAALRTMDLSPKLDPSALRIMDLSPKLTPPVSAKDVVVPEAVCSQEAGVVGEGVRMRVIGCGLKLRGARTLSEAALRLKGFAQELLALQNAGWQLQEPIAGVDDVVIVRQEAPRAD